MREIDLDILPSIRAMADPIAFVLPTSTEWVGWEALRITDTEEEFLEHVLDLSHAGLDDALLVLLGCSAPTCGNSRMRLIARPAAAARNGLSKTGCSPRKRQADIGRDRCRRHFQRRSFQSGLFPFPGSSAAASTIRFRNIPEWSSGCLDEIGRIAPSIDAPALTNKAAKLFPLLLGARGTDCLLPCSSPTSPETHGTKRAGPAGIVRAIPGTAQVRTDRARVSQCVEICRRSSNPAVLGFMRSRNHRMPAHQLEC